MLQKLQNAVPQDEDTIKQIISEVVPTYHCPEKAKKEQKTAVGAC